MSRLLFFLTSISFIALGYGYLGCDFTDMHMWVRVGWGGLYFTVLMLGFSAAWFLVRQAPDAVQKSAPNTNSRATGNARNLAVADIDRRAFLKVAFNSGVMMVSGAMTVAGVRAGAQPPKITRIAVPLQDLPDELQGFRIVQISDLHLNTTTRVKWLQDIVAQSNSLLPDMVAFTGDFADTLLADLAVVLAPITGLSSRFGNYFVTGNHEYSYGHGILREGGVQPWKRKVEKIGFNVLLNENRLLTIGHGRLLLAGVTDYEAGISLAAHASSPTAALRDAPPADVKILLAHQPKSIYPSAGLGFDLQLSGHTHGGQFFPGQVLMGLTQPAVAGLQNFEGTWIYVNRGTGFWGPPLRLGTFPEITLLTLTRPVNKGGTHS